MKKKGEYVLIADVIIYIYIYIKGEYVLIADVIIYIYIYTHTNTHI